MTSTGSIVGRCGGIDRFGRVAQALASSLPEAAADGDATAGEQGETERLTGERPTETRNGERPTEASPRGR